MKRPFHYIDAARKRMDLRSDRELARMMNLSPSTISYWREERMFPDKENLRLLADLAGWEPDEARFWSAYWHADEAVQAVLLKAVKLAAPVLIALALLASPAIADTGEQNGNYDQPILRKYILSHNDTGLVRAWKADRLVGPGSIILA